MLGFWHAASGSSWRLRAGFEREDARGHLLYGRVCRAAVANTRLTNEYKAQPESDFSMKIKRSYLRSGVFRCLLVALWLAGTAGWPTGAAELSSVMAGKWEITALDGNPSVNIPDPQLEASIRRSLNQPAGDLTTIDLLSLTNLYASWSGLANLDGLSTAIQLNDLDLGHNLITKCNDIKVVTTAA
ncbi:MAG: hypothetical protein AAB676_09340 [Verrucomicrobiota bacterium]